MRIIETKVYTINEHPDKEKCFNWIRENWHDLNEHYTHEIVQSIKSLSEKIDSEFDYSFDQYGDGYIEFKNYNKKLLNKLKAKELPLTGVCWDFHLILGLRANNPNRVLAQLKKDTNYIYSDEGLLELCEANDYEFDINGNYIGF